MVKKYVISLLMNHAVRLWRLCYKFGHSPECVEYSISILIKYANNFNSSKEFEFFLNRYLDVVYVVATKYVEDNKNLYIEDVMCNKNNKTEKAKLMKTERKILDGIKWNLHETTVLQILYEEYNLKPDVILNSIFIAFTFSSMFYMYKNTELAKAIYFIYKNVTTDNEIVNRFIKEHLKVNSNTVMKYLNTLLDFNEYISFILFCKKRNVKLKYNTMEGSKKTNRYRQYNLTVCDGKQVLCLIKNPDFDDLKNNYPDFEENAEKYLTDEMNEIYNGTKISHKPILTRVCGLTLLENDILDIKQTSNFIQSAQCAEIVNKIMLLLNTEGKFKKDDLFSKISKILRPYKIKIVNLVISELQSQRENTIENDVLCKRIEFVCSEIKKKILCNE